MQVRVLTFFVQRVLNSSLSAVNLHNNSFRLVEARLLRFDFAIGWSAGNLRHHEPLPPLVKTMSLTVQIVGEEEKSKCGVKQIARTEHID